jgi:hypothetical protein
MQSKQYRKVCFDEHGRVCVICGSGDDVVAHHVNGDRTCNKPENLRPMCRSCHRSVHQGNADEWSERLPQRSIIGRPGTELRPQAISVLHVLADGRSNPRWIRENTDLTSSQINTVLNRLARSGCVEQVTRGLYEATDDGLDKVSGDD